MSEIRVEQATIKDLDNVVTIFDQYRVFYQQPSDPEAARRFLFDKFEHRESVIFIAKGSSSSEAVGFVQLYPTFSSVSMKRSWILNDLFVKESFRKQGVATLLLNQAKEFAVLTRAKGIELSTALANLKAQQLYESLGYKKDEEYFHYYLSL